MKTKGIYCRHSAVLSCTVAVSLLGATVVLVEGLSDALVLQSPDHFQPSNTCTGRAYALHEHVQCMPRHRCLHGTVTDSCGSSRHNHVCCRLRHDLFPKDSGGFVSLSAVQRRIYHAKNSSDYATQIPQVSLSPSSMRNSLKHVDRYNNGHHFPERWSNQESELSKRMLFVGNERNEAPKKTYIYPFRTSHSVYINKKHMNVHDSPQKYANTDANYRISPFSHRQSSNYGNPHSERYTLNRLTPLRTRITLSNYRKQDETSQIKKNSLHFRLENPFDRYSSSGKTPLSNYRNHSRRNITSVNIIDEDPPSGMSYILVNTNALEGSLTPESNHVYDHKNPDHRNLENNTALGDWSRIFNVISDARSKYMKHNHKSSTLDSKTLSTTKSTSKHQSSVELSATNHISKQPDESTEQSMTTKWASKYSTFSQHSATNDVKTNAGTEKTSIDPWVRPTRKRGNFRKKPPRQSNTSKGSEQAYPMDISTNLITTLTTEKGFGTTENTKDALLMASSDNQTLPSNKEPSSLEINTSILDSSIQHVDSNECGFAPLEKSTGPAPEMRIVGGDQVEFGTVPWQVSVRRTTLFGLTSSHRCGGALLNEQWIVSAAHCVSDIATSSLLVRAGEHDMNSHWELLPHQERSAKLKLLHPDYDRHTFENDLALVKLSAELQLAPHIRPICLPAADDLLVGEMATVSGWGRLKNGGAMPSVMHKAIVPIMENWQCAEMFNKSGRSELIPDVFVCAGYAGGGIDSCQGDSGGPLQLRGKNGRWFLAGVISWGIGCAEPNLPGVCTRISKFTDWIVQQVNHN